MKVLLLLLRSYPPDFRVRFEQEMVETLRGAYSEAGGRRAGWLIRECAGIAAGAAWEWIAIGIARLTRVLELAATAAAAGALQAFAYGALIPIGARAEATTGAALYELGVLLLSIAAVAGALCRVRSMRGRSLLLMAIGCTAGAQQDFRAEAIKAYEAAFSAMRDAKTGEDIQRLMDSLDAPEWQGVLPSGAILTRSEARTNLEALLTVPPERRPIPRLHVLHAADTGEHGVTVYWVYRRSGDELAGSLARDTWMRTPQGWRRTRHEKLLPDQPLVRKGKALVLPEP